MFNGPNLRDLGIRITIAGLAIAAFLGMVWSTVSVFVWAYQGLFGGG